MSLRQFTVISRKFKVETIHLSSLEFGVNKTEYFVQGKYFEGIRNLVIKPECKYFVSLS